MVEWLQSKRAHQGCAFSSVSLGSPLLFQMETLQARNYAENRCKIFSLISVVKLLIYSLCVTYLITVKLVRDEDVNRVFSVLSVVGSGSVLSQIIWKIRLL